MTPLERALDAVAPLMQTPGDWVRLAMAALDQADVDATTQARIQTLAVDAASSAIDRKAARVRRLADIEPIATLAEMACHVEEDR